VGSFDKLRSFAESRESSAAVIRGGLTYGDARELLAMFQDPSLAADIASLKDENFRAAMDKGKEMAGEVFRLRDELRDERARIIWLIDEAAAELEETRKERDEALASEREAIRAMAENGKELLAARADMERLRAALGRWATIPLSDHQAGCGCRGCETDALLSPVGKGSK